LNLSLIDRGRLPRGIGSGKYRRVKCTPGSARRFGAQYRESDNDGNQTPNAPPSTALNGEWGLSMHAESWRGNELRNILIDFGYTPETLLNNMSILKIDPSSFDALVLSHGHYDHFGGMVGFLSANKGKLKKNLPFFVGGEDCFCTRENALGQYGALDRKAIVDANLSLMMAEGPAIVADHAFTTGKIAQVSSEKPLQPTREKVGIVNGFGCFPDKMSPAKNTGTFILDDFEHATDTAQAEDARGRSKPTDPCQCEGETRGCAHSHEGCAGQGSDRSALPFAKGKARRAQGLRRRGECQGSLDRRRGRSKG
jgi:Metallo-beta-lactamase superfamily